MALIRGRLSWDQDRKIQTLKKKFVFRAAADQMVSLWTKWLFPEIFHFKAEMNWELSAKESVTSKTGHSQENIKEQ